MSFHSSTYSSKKSSVNASSVLDKVNSFDPNNISKEELEEILNKAEERIVVAKIYLLMKYPYIGEIGSKMENTPSWHFPTAATDGRRLFYNPIFINEITEKGVLFTVAHEILHVLLDHVFRRGDRIPYVWNLAIDYITNSILDREKIGEAPFSEIVFDKNYTDEKYSAEELYELLLKENNLTTFTFDIHLDSIENDEKEGDNNNGSGVGVSNGSGGKKEKISVTVFGDMPSKEEIEEIRNQIKAHISSSKTYAAGNIPAGIKRIIESFNNPEINWKDYIYSKILEFNINDYNFFRPHNQSWVRDVIVPSIRSPEEKFILNVFIDASGSIRDKELRDFFSEVMGILGNISLYEMNVYSFDTDAYKICKFDNFNFNDKDFLKKLSECKGGGGTMFGCIFNELSKVGNYVNSTLVVFTDGYCFDEWGKNELNKLGGEHVFQDIIFVLKNMDHNMKAPFGKTLRMKGSN